MAINGGYRYRHTVGAAANGRLVIEYLAEHFPHSSTTVWKSRVEAGEIWVDESLADCVTILKPGQVLVWDRPGWQEEEVPRNIEIVYQDDFLLVVNKPSGLPTLPGAGFYENTLLRLVQEKCSAAIPLHRLGRGTSGLVIFALNRQVAASMHSDWSLIQKRYLALGQGLALEPSYAIDAPIGPCQHPRLGLVHAATSNGKRARSLATVLETDADSTLFEVLLLTGRPHQIRIHLAYIGHPLVGDPLYASGGLPQSESPGLPGDLGYFLHAQQLDFVHPITKQEMRLTTSLPTWVHSR